MLIRWLLFIWHKNCRTECLPQMYTIAMSVSASEGRFGPLSLYSAAAVSWLVSSFPSLQSWFEMLFWGCFSPTLHRCKWILKVQGRRESALCYAYVWFGNYPCFSGLAVGLSQTKYSALISPYLSGAQRAWGWVWHTFLDRQITGTHCF